MKELAFPVLTYTLLRNYESCERKAWHYNIAKTVPYEKSDAQDWGKAAHDALAARVHRGTPLPGGFEHYERFCQFPAGYRIATEKKMGMKVDGSPCGFFDPDVAVRGVADVVIEGQPLSQQAALVDWKTGGNKKYTDDSELRLHALLFKSHNKHIESIKGWYVWLKDGEVGKPYDLSDFAGTWAELAKARRDITERMKYGPDGFSPTESPLCSYCNVFSCELNPRRAR